MSAPALTKAEQRQVDAAAEILKPWGLPWTIEMGGKHLCMRIAGPRGGSYRLVIACTPRNEGNAVDLTRQKARRLVKEINERAGVYRMGRTG